MDDLDERYYDQNLDDEQDDGDYSLEENVTLLLQYTYSRIVYPINDGICTSASVFISQATSQALATFITALQNHQYPNDSVYFRFYLFKRDVADKAISLLLQQGYRLPARDYDFVDEYVLPCLSRTCAYYFEDY